MESENRITFVVPRMHTNMLGWLEGLRKNNVDIRVLVQTCSISENHEQFVPEKISDDGSPYAVGKTWFRSPKSLFALRRKLLEAPFSKVVFRFEINLTSLVLLLNILMSRLPFAIYQQWPILGLPKYKHYFRRLLMKLTGAPFFSPVMSLEKVWIKNQRGWSNLDTQLTFIPFAISSRESKMENKSSLTAPVKLICIGKYQRRKSHHQLVTNLLNNTTFMTSDSTLDIYGEVSTAEHFLVKKELASLIRHFRADKKIKLYENVPHSDLTQRLMYYDVFVLISKNEPASISNLEAMRCGLAVIIGVDNGTANYIEQGKGGYIVNEDLDFQVAIDKLIKDGDFRIMCGKHNLRTVKELMNPQTVAKAIMDLYK